MTATHVLPAGVDRFLAELSADPELRPAAAEFRKVLIATDRAADRCAHHLNFFQAISLICAEPRPLHERLEAIKEIVDLTAQGRDQGGGIVTVTIKRAAA